MPLTHVYTIRNKKLTNVTVRDVEKMGRTSGLFCKLCGERVKFVSESYRRGAFFQHSPNPGKTCEQKTDGSWGVSYYKPLRQRSSTSDFFIRLDPRRLHAPGASIALEFVLPPLSEMERKTMIAAGVKFEVRCGSCVLGACSADRLSESGRSYIALDRQIGSSYQLFVAARENVYRFTRFKTSIYGFDEEGMLFSAMTGRRIPFQGEVYVGEAYVWICKSEHAPRWVGDVRIQLIAKLGDGWSAYWVRATRLSDQAVVSFIRFGAALCDFGDVAFPLWPPFVRKDELACIDPHEGQFWGAKADALRGTIPSMVGSDGQIVSSLCRDLVAPKPFLYSPYDYADKVAKDVEIWKMAFHGEALQPFVEISDPDCRGNDQSVAYGEYKKLPVKGRLNFRARSEGHIELCYPSGRQERRSLRAHDLLSIDVVQGMSLSVYQGLDCLGKIVYLKRPSAHGTKCCLSQIERRWLAREEFGSVDDRMLRRLAVRAEDCPELQKRIQALVQGSEAGPRTVAVIRKHLNGKI